MNPFWHQRCAEPGDKYGAEPKAFLRERAARLPANARVLLPGDREGRNGVWLAALREDFAGRLDERLALDGETVLDEGPGHRGAARLARDVGRRPIAPG